MCVVVVRWQRMEFERVQEEYRDTQQRLEKQIDELRNAVRLCLVVNV